MGFKHILLWAVALLGVVQAATYPPQSTTLALAANSCTSVDHKLYGDKVYGIYLENVTLPADGVLCTQSEVFVSTSVLSKKDCLDASTISGGAVTCSKHYTNDASSCEAVSPERSKSYALPACSVCSVRYQEWRHELRFACFVGKQKTKFYVSYIVQDFASNTSSMMSPLSDDAQYDDSMTWSVGQSCVKGTGFLYVKNTCSRDITIQLKVSDCCFLLMKQSEALIEIRIRT